MVDVQCRYTRSFTVPECHTILAVRAHCLQEIVERLEPLEVGVVFCPKLVHSLIRFVCCTINPGNDGSQRRIVVHCAKSASQVDKTID